MIRCSFVLVAAVVLLIALQGCGPSATDNAIPARGETRGSAPLQPGDTAPDVPLTGHNGDTFSLAGRLPRAVLLTFIFTRCHAMEFCPAQSMKFRELRAALDASPLGEKVELVSVTLDPEHDTPEVLAAYARGLDAQQGRWTFAASSRDVLERLKRNFGVRAELSGETGTIEHNLVTALIDGRGRLRRSWEGNKWQTEEVMAEISAATGWNASGS